MSLGSMHDFLRIKQQLNRMEQRQIDAAERSKVMDLKLDDLVAAVEDIKTDVERLIAARHDDTAALAAQGKLDSLTGSLKELKAKADADLAPPPATAPPAAPVATESPPVAAAPAPAAPVAPAAPEAAAAPAAPPAPPAAG